MSSCRLPRGRREEEEKDQHKKIGGGGVEFDPIQLPSACFLRFFFILLVLIFFGGPRDAKNVPFPCSWAS